MWFIVSAGGGGAEVKSTTGVVSGVSAVWEGAGPAGGSGMTAFATGGAILLHGGGPELPAGAMCPGGGGVMGVPLGSGGGALAAKPASPIVIGGPAAMPAPAVGAIGVVAGPEPPGALLVGGGGRARYDHRLAAKAWSGSARRTRGRPSFRLAWRCQGYHHQRRQPQQCRAAHGYVQSG